MSRKKVEQIVSAAQGALVDNERVTEFGPCWAAELKPRVPLLVTARRQYLMVLSDRRLLLFTRRWRRKRLAARDLVIGKRYEAFSVSRVRRARPLYSVRVTATNGAQMVFEFRLGQRHLGGALVARLTPAQPALPPRVVPDPRARSGVGGTDRGDATAATNPVDAPVQTLPTSPRDGRDAAEETDFWGPRRAARERRPGHRRRHDRRPDLGRGRPGCGARPRRTASSPSTSRGPAGSSTTPSTSATPRSRPSVRSRRAAADAGETVAAIGITNQRETDGGLGPAQRPAPPPGDRVAGPSHRRALRRAASRRA